jgi:hypothetical protein
VIEAWRSGVVPVLQEQGDEEYEEYGEYGVVDAWDDRTKRVAHMHLLDTNEPGGI